MVTTVLSLTNRGQRHIYAVVEEIKEQHGMGRRLGQFEEFILLALVRLRENAYGVTIRREIAERTGRDVSVGAVYATLERLERKGYVSSWMGEATPERGGRAKRYFKIEAPGAEALSEVTTATARLAEGLAHA